VKIRGSSRIFASSEQHRTGSRPWLIGLSLYGLAAGVDLAYHLIDHLYTGDQMIAFSEVAVAFSAALFWPVDVVAMALLATR
jgi:hypothetical protein